MYDLFGSVKGLLKIDSVSIDNSVFKLHYKVTGVILVVFSLLVTSYQYIGDPIDCAYTTSRIPSKVMDTYCWIHSTYTVEQATEQQGREAAHTGVGPQRDSDTTQRHAYYQWVCFFLFFQAILFYVPRFLWKSWEGGKLKMLVMELNCPIIEDQARCDRKKLLVEYLTCNMHNHNFYAIKFFFCEVLNLVNVVGQIFFIDYFLDYEFTRYGIRVLEFAQTMPVERADPMELLFPKVTKCRFELFGQSVTPQTIDAICVLPLNIVNEKIYVALWFWLVALSTVTGLALLYRALVILLPQLRAYLLRARARLAPGQLVAQLCSRLQLGDWFLLYQLGKSIDPLVFKEVVTDLSRALDTHI